MVTPSMLTLGIKGVDPTSLYWYFTFRERVRANIVGYGSVLKNGLTVLPRDHRYFHLFNMWGTGYYHWLTEVAPKFLLFETQLQDGTVLIPPNPPRYIKEFFELLGFGDSISVSKCYFAFELNVVTNPGVGQHDPKYISRLRGRVFESLNIKPSGNNRRIYVSRRQAARRKVGNEEELVESLKQRGFECVELEDFSFSEQVRLFAQCSRFVSIHGAALTNCIFMPERSKVFELFPKPTSSNDYVNPCFENLCSAMNIDHEFIFSRRAKPRDNYNFHTDDILVDVESVTRSIA